MAELDREIAAEPGNSRPLQYRGLNYAILGEKEKAIADYKAAQKISPQQKYLYWSFGWALFDLGEYSSAVVVWENVVAQMEAKPEPELNRLDALHGMGDGWVFYTLALGYWGAGDKDRAFAYFTEAAKMSSSMKTREKFEAFTDHWTQKEQTMALALFDAWQKEVEKPGSHLW